MEETPFLEAERSDNDSIVHYVIIHMKRRKKKRQLAAIYAAVYTVTAVEEHNRNKTKQYSVIGRSVNTKRNRGPVTTQILLLAEQNRALFKRMYRLDVDDFFELLGKIRPSLESNQRCTDNHIDAEIYLAVALRYLAGGNYLDLAFGYNLPQNCIHQYALKVLELIDEKVDNIDFPVSDIEKLQQLESRFNELAEGHFTGTVAAGDGIVFPISKPAKEEIYEDVVSFFTKKDYYAFGLQAFCDADCKFLSICGGVCAATNDGTTAHLTTLLKRHIDVGFLPEQFHVVLDDAYMCSDQELSSWKGSNLEVEKDSFNYWLSKQRHCIVRAFEILTKRWGIFWRKLSVKMENIPLIIRVACKLHNICIDRFGADSVLEVHTSTAQFGNIGFGTDFQPGDDKDNVRYTDGTGMTQGFRDDLVVCSHRDSITAYLKSAQIKRPTNLNVEPLVVVKRI